MKNGVEEPSSVISRTTGKDNAILLFPNQQRGSNLVFTMARNVDSGATASISASATYSPSSPIMRIIVPLEEPGGIFGGGSQSASSIAVVRLHCVCQANLNADFPEQNVRRASGGTSVGWALRVK